MGKKAFIAAASLIACAACSCSIPIDECALQVSCPPPVEALVSFEGTLANLDGARLEICTKGACVSSSIEVRSYSAYAAPDVSCKRPPEMPNLLCADSLRGGGELRLEFPAEEGDTVWIRILGRNDAGLADVLGSQYGTMVRQTVVRESCSESRECSHLVLR